MIKSDPIDCKICGFLCSGQVSGGHLKKHGISSAEYRLKYGPTQTETFRAHCREVGARGGGNQGSREAVRALKEQRMSLYYSSPTHCPCCSNVLPYERDSRQIFCSHSCASSFRQREGGNRYIPRNCKHCETALKRGQKHYCDRSCQWKHKAGEIIAEWRDGKCTNRSLPDSVITALKEQAGHKCTECGWCRVHPKTGKVPLQIDHINGNRHDHRPTNLRVLCGGCHSLTETYGNLNPRRYA